MLVTGEKFKNYALSLSKRIVGKHISRPLLISRCTLFFHLSGKEERRFVISLENGDPRAYTAINEYNIPSLDSPIYSVFRKELANAFVDSLDVENNDRILRFSLSVVSRVYKEEKRFLFFEMFPAHPNLILTDENLKIIAFTHGSSLDSSRPILKGILYQAPTKKFMEGKDAPFDYSRYKEACLEEEKLIFASRKKERFGPLFLALMNKEKRLKRKLSFIEKDEEKAKSHQFDNEIADFIFTNLDTLSDQKELIFQGKTISLDERKTLVQNANDFYKKAKKAKIALRECEAKKEKASKELLSIQENIALFSKSDEEGLELLSKEWNLTNHKKELPDFGNANIPYEIEINGTRFLFGKNAKQNDALTFLIDTVKTHYWFHIQGREGAHVMIKKDDPNKDEILSACEIALLSKGKEDGDVIMSLRKNVYKGSAPGQVILREYKTIHLKTVRKETKSLFERARKMKL